MPRFRITIEITQDIEAETAYAAVQEILSAVVRPDLRDVKRVEELIPQPDLTVGVDDKEWRK